MATVTSARELSSAQLSALSFGARLRSSQMLTTRVLTAAVPMMGLTMRR